MDVTNKTRKPLSVPLPGGKKLHLGPGKTAKITPKAAEFPPLAKLVEGGELELFGGGAKSGGGPSDGNAGGVGNAGRKSSGGIRHVGDR